MVRPAAKASEMILADGVIRRNDHALLVMTVIGAAEAESGNAWIANGVVFPVLSS
jgi:hypothetical protein